MDIREASILANIGDLFVMNHTKMGIYVGIKRWKSVKGLEMGSVQNVGDVP